jgi:hypothetical protein
VTPAKASIDELFVANGELFLASHGRGLFKQYLPAHAYADPTVPGCVFPGTPGGFSARATPPVIGQRFDVLLTQGPPFAISAAFVSLVPARPFQWTAACVVYGDLNFGLLTLFNGVPLDASGSARIGFQLANQPALVGADLAGQAIAGTPTGQIWTSNGLRVRVGW